MVKLFDAGQAISKNARKIFDLVIDIQPSRCDLQISLGREPPTIHEDSGLEREGVSTGTLSLNDAKDFTIRIRVVGVRKLW